MSDDAKYLQSDIALLEMFSDSHVLAHGAAGEAALTVGDVLSHLRRSVDKSDEIERLRATQLRYQLCEGHTDGSLQRAESCGTCVECRVAYLEAQETLLEEWQQRAKRAEETIAEIKRPLDAQMARLNETVAQRNAENERLRAEIGRMAGNIMQSSLDNREVDEQLRAEITRLIAAIATARRDALEEAAKVCKKFAQRIYDEEGSTDIETGERMIPPRFMDTVEAYEYCEEQIRALAEKEER